MARKYGWKRGLPDHRDQLYTASQHLMMAELPPKVDLRPNCPAVYDQGDLGSCTANALGGNYQYDEIKQDNGVKWMPSRLFIYYNERFMEGTVNEDSGAQIRDGIKSLATYGVCPEEMWPYDVAAFKRKPLKKCYTKAEGARISSYLKLDNTKIDDLKHCLSEGLPFVFGFVVYEGFEGDEVAKTGKMPMPAKDEQPLGGHAVMCVGYDDEMKCFIVRNSWGDGWGDQGYFYMPYEFMISRSYCDDFWVIRYVPKEA